ncbi:VPLPA-CTERM sorting domain-containing protein [uncultured Roseobacter sp.]|uniref:VPLPA-CTERM sorting domain-containing protein n=1 Tax=uncultured Roseobacter sp. TaxID=114847 RepID=UPI002601BB95|nr:VPLPA-CTERM sorting domain-containing protein [uncultured Roseobacter sp.]
MFPNKTTASESASATGNSTGQTSSSVDLETGQLKSGASISNVSEPDTFARATGITGWMEFVTFSTSTTVDFALAVDGFLNIANEIDTATYRAGVSLYDVTDQERVFASNGFFRPETRSNEVFNANGFTRLFGLDVPEDPFVDCSAPEERCVFGTGQSGYYESVLTGSVNVVAGRQYLIAAELLTDALRQGAGAGDVSADFLSTAQFNFTDLGGATFESASGTFLSKAPLLAPVPLPASLSMMLAALGGIGIVARRRKRAES